MLSIGPISYKPGSFTFQIVTTTANETFTLPLGSSGAYKHKFMVYWGDTTSDLITAYNSAARVHTYVVAGTYNIQLVGVCQYFAFDNDGTYGVSKAKVYKLLEFTGDMGFNYLNFYGCSKLDTLVPLGSLKALTTAYNMFNSGSSNNITTVPAGIFDGCTKINTFWSCFYNCPKLTTIPSDLFKYNILATNFSSCFQNCSKLTAIPADLFKYNVLANNFTATFNNCAVVPSIPLDLFRYNTAVLNFTTTFYRCYLVPSIPTDLFRYNTLAWNFTSTFQDCTALTSIPAGLFKYNTVAWNFASTFQGCVKAQLNDTIFCDAGDKGTRFLDRTNLTFANCFNRTYFTGIIGIAPDLWNYGFGSVTPTKTTCYGGAGNNILSLLNYLDVPAAWK